MTETWHSTACMMQVGHVSLPNGTGLDYTDADGQEIRRELAPNEFTDASRRDFLAGTPWHKHIPARIELLSTPWKRSR